VTSASDLPCVQEAKYGNADWWTAWPGSRHNTLAKTCCQACPLQQQCANVALEDGIPYGVWGGLDERDRAVIWRQSGGRPTIFDQILDQETLALLQRRRDEAKDGLGGAA
jgi:hypothetical protein